MSLFELDEVKLWLMRRAFTDGQMQLAQLDVPMACVTWTMVCEGGWTLAYPRKIRP